MTWFHKDLRSCKIGYKPQYPWDITGSEFIAVAPAALFVNSTLTLSIILSELHVQVHDSLKSGDKIQPNYLWANFCQHKALWSLFKVNRIFNEQENWSGRGHTGAVCATLVPHCTHCTTLGLCSGQEGKETDYSHQKEGWQKRSDKLLVQPLLWIAP